MYRINMLEELPTQASVLSGFTENNVARCGNMGFARSSSRVYSAPYRRRVTPIASRCSSSRSRRLARRRQPSARAPTPALAWIALSSYIIRFIIVRMGTMSGAARAPWPGLPSYAFNFSQTKQATQRREKVWGESTGSLHRPKDGKASGAMVQWRVRSLARSLAGVYIVGETGRRHRVH
jgi:hypothetical protein